MLAENSSGLGEATLVWLMVAGLVVVSVLIGVWTVRFWIATRPEIGGSTPDTRGRHSVFD